MYWELSADYVGSGSLVGTVNSVLGALDQTANHLLYPGSQFVNMQNCMGGCSGISNPPPPATTSTTTHAATTTTTTTSKAATTTSVVTTSKGLPIRLLIF